jgi:hypothetical protein
MSEPIESLYFNWLVAKVTDPHARTPSQTHWKLLLQMQNTEFLWNVARDDNRAEDGMNLRNEYLIQTGEHPPPDWFIVGCSVLEMIYALSRQAAFKDGRHPYEWFWEIVENLGLAYLDDASDYDSPFVADVLDRLVWRTYDRHGNGGMFPIRNPYLDQRRVEIWYQLEGYLAEREHAM